MEDTTANEINKNTNWVNLLKIIKNDQFEEKYPSYTIQKRDRGGYFLIESNKENKEQNNIFLFDEKKKLQIFIEDKAEILNIYSSIEIEDFVKAKNFELKDLYIKDTNEQYLDIKQYLSYYLKNKNELEIKKKKKIPNLFLKNLLNEDLDYTPEEYSQYFYEYFIYEDKSEKNRIFVYMKSKTRGIIEDNIIKLKNNKDLKEYNLTGPTSIGKSFTLFRISRIFYNCIYINLKVLNKHKKDLYLCYCIIISELERLDIRKNEISLLNTIIENNYSKNYNYLTLLLNIIDYLSTIKHLIFVVILDQYKNKYLNSGFMEKIKVYENLKIIKCGSINDKNFREECLKTWTTKGKNILALTVDIQNYYIYYSTLYSQNE